MLNLMVKSILCAAVGVLCICMLTAAQGSTSSNDPRAFRNIEYSHVDGRSLLMDIYTPQDTKRRAPVILWIHGGGWQSGDKQDTLPVAMGFIGRGYAVVTLNYRLSSEGIFPAQIIDCKSAVRWLRANARKYNLDSKHIAAWGHSAGGHLAALLGVTNGVKEFDAGDNLDQSSDVQVVCSYAGVMDFTRLALTPGFEWWRTADNGAALVLGGPIMANKDRADKASPLFYVSKTTVPMLLYTGDKDDLVAPDQSITMRYALSKVGVESELHIFKGCGHAGEPFMTREAASQIAAFFDKRMR